MDSWGLALHADKIKPNHGIPDLPNAARFLAPSAAAKLKRKKMADGDPDGANRVHPLMLLTQEGSEPATVENRGENI